MLGGVQRAGHELLLVGGAAVLGDVHARLLDLVRVQVGVGVGSNPNPNLTLTLTLTLTLPQPLPIPNPNLGGDAEQPRHLEPEEHQERGAAHPHDLRDERREGDPD